MNCSPSFGLLGSLNSPTLHPLNLETLKMNPVTVAHQQLYMNNILQQFNPIQNPFLVAQLQLANALKENACNFPFRNNEFAFDDSNDSSIDVSSHVSGTSVTESIDLTKTRIISHEKREVSECLITDDEVLDKIKGKDITVSRIHCSDDPQDQTVTIPVGLTLTSRVPRDSESVTTQAPAPAEASLKPLTNYTPINLGNFDPEPATSPLQSSSSETPSRTQDVDLNSSAPLPPEQALIMKALVSVRQRKPRGQKKPIPDEMKTERYYERRSRNNRAAKKSRDQRKLRESLITQRAAFLEAENAHFRLKIAEFKKQLLAMDLLLAERGIEPKNVNKSFQ
ncbi:uncharacterized protein LOC108674153 isoform X2 [Hyalella azteca]|uniref:Uncharacterized protein LOC108674153 isoform X2 n=1 Tax=Hyalella azteca TaxID=294128 RepID=A0A8B7NV14_HYAAZ|nr:uncharacterized protein LOC108674153 isoform X2 [Hyalella azteca]